MMMMSQPFSTARANLGLRILVVEDSFLAASSLSRLLERLGCTVVGPAPTVTDALRLISERPFDAAILDINLGSETAEPIAAELDRRGTPFLFVTGYNSPRLLSEAYLGRRRVLKPVEFAVLHAAMQEEFQR